MLTGGAPEEALWTFPYDREAAVEYAHKWAFGRNPDFYDYQYIGGDCTNFASQCLYAGTGVMNFTPTFGWFYINANYKAPAWTGVPYFYNFLTREIQDRGPFGIEVPITEILPGDFVQLNFNGEIFAHTPVIVSVGSPPTLQNVLVAAHSVDVDNTPLTEFPAQEIRFIHILGYRA